MHLILHAFPSPNQETAWRDFLGRAEVPSHYNAPEFFLETRWAGKRPFAVLALDYGKVVGAVTGIHEGDQVECGVPTRPQICFDKTVERTPVLEALAQGLLAEAGPAKLVAVYSWTLLDPLLRHGFRCRQTEGVVMLDLRQGKEEIFKQLDRKRRNNIRSSIRQGVEIVQAATTEDFVAYYEIYKNWRKRKGRVPRPFDQELTAFHSTTRNRRLFLARVSGTIVAGTIIRFFPGGLAEYSRNNSLSEFLNFKPNDLLQWTAIEWACAEGLSCYSLGASGPFHREFGGQIAPIYRYRLDRTWLCQHDLREAVLDTGRQALHKMPTPIEKMLRQLLGKMAPKI